MSNTEKLEMLKTMLNICGNESDSTLSVYLSAAESSILAIKYGGTKSTLSAEDDMVQIFAAMAGFGHEGAPDEKGHNENGINRTWAHSDMLAYVQANCPRYVRMC